MGEDETELVAVDEDGLIKILQQACRDAGGAASWTRAQRDPNGKPISVGFVNDVIHKRRKVGKRLPGMLGAEQVVRWVIKQPKPS